MKKATIHIVPHTHWDKEWYFTKQDTDILLNNNMEWLFHIMEQYHESFSFTFDGQTSIVDDYLQFANETNKSKLFYYLKNKKIIIGPWYIQPDFF